MKHNLQNGSAFHQRREKILLMICGVLLTTVLSWLSRDVIPGPLFAFGSALITAVAVWRLLFCLELREEEIREKERMISEMRLEKMRANLLKSISHDIRTPLANISGSSELMLEQTISDEKRWELLTNIHEDAKWLINMIENLLIVSRINGDSLSVSTSEEVVEEIVSEAVNKIEKRYPDISVDVIIPDDYIMVPMDACLIEQTLINLAENAILHSGNANKVQMIVRDSPHTVILSVRDHGAGIPEEKLPHLFDGGIYSESDSPDAYRGLGIGLTICKTIVSAHHGTIIGRNYEEGAEFVITLPKE